MADNKKREILTVLMTEILADHKWNARSGNWKSSGPNEETGDGGFSGLVDSIKARGQDEPVTIRLNPDQKSRSKYLLVTGFRRYEACAAIALEENNKAPTIQAELRNLTETEARALNIRENTARDDFTVPDLAWSIAELGKTGATDQAIAAEIGKSQGYVSMLHRVMKKTDAKVLQAWRESPVQLEIRTMTKISEEKPEEQATAYKDALKALVEKKREKGEEEKEAKRIDGLKSRAETFGEMFGKLDGHGFLDSSGVVFLDCIDDIMTLPADFTKKNRTSVASAMERGYKAGLKAVADEAEEPEAEEAAE